MLHELARYAEKQQLSGLPGYKTKRVRWVIVLDESGRYVDLSEMQRGEDEYLCPHLEQGELIGGKTARSHFLLDSAAVVTGYGREEGDAKRVEKRDCFIQLLHQCADACAELEWCALALEDPAGVARINEALAARKAKPTDGVTFRVGSRLVTELSEWQGWWQKYRASLARGDQDGETMICFQSGELTAPVPTHAKVSGLSRVGGRPSATLISFDKEAFGSFGLSQSSNAACSETAVALYRSALDHLVSQSPPPLGGALFLHWYSEKIKVQDDVISELMSFGEASEAANAQLKARELLTAVRSGTRPELSRNRYYVLQVSGSGGRVMVRDWFTGDFVKLVESVKAWYDDLEITQPLGVGLAEPPKLRGLLTRLVSYRPGEKYQDTTERVDKQLAPTLPRLWRAILEGGSLPDAAAQGALAYTRSRLLREDEERKTDNLDRLACAVLKAWIVRKVAGESKKETKVEANLNRNHPASAYQAGRLMAVLAALQTSALGDVGAGVVQRYYAAASTTPSLVLGRLVRNAQYHLQKIESKGLAVWFEKQIAEIMSRLGDQPPAILDMEGQTLFALGYYQQKAELYSKRTEEPASQANEGGN